MESPQSQQLQQVNEKNNDYLCVKVFQLFSKGGIKVLDEHKELVSGFPETSSDGSAEAKADSQDKSSLSISGAGHNKHVNILHIAAAYVNKKGINGRTPLHLAAGTVDTELVDLFLRAGADAGAEDISTFTPIHFSAFNGRINIVEILLKAGANVNAENYWKQTPLHLNAAKGNKELVEVLLKAGANVNAENYRKQTPLHLNSAKEDKELVEVLLKAGANINAEDKDKQTPLHLSVANENKKVVENLLKAGANVNAPDMNKQTPLHISAEQKHDDISELLFRAGASVNEKDIEGRSVLDYMDDELRVRLGFEPRPLFKLRNWMYTLTKSKKHVESSTSSKTKTEHTETIRATFTDLDTRRYREIHTFTNKDSSKENGQVYKAQGSSTSLTTGPQPGRSAVTSSGPGPQLGSPAGTSSGLGSQLGRSAVTSSGPGPQLGMSAATSSGPGPQLGWSAVTSSGLGPQLGRSAVTSSGADLLSGPPPPSESHDLDDSDLQELSNIRQQVENHWTKFSPETTEGCDTSCSSEVKTARQPGRIVISPTMNVTLNKTIKNVNIVNHHYEPGASLIIKHAEAVAPNGQIVVHHNMKVTDDDGDSYDGDGKS